MAKDQDTQGRSRLTLDLSKRMTAVLNQYAERHGVSKADALRNALELLAAAENAADEGLKVGAWGVSDGNRIEQVFIGFRP